MNLKFPNFVFVVAALGLGSLPSNAANASNFANPKEKKVAVNMNDIKYSTKSLSVKAGTTVEFSFSNKSNVRHEAVIGTHAEQLAHDKEMAAMGGMAMGDEPTAISVAPGKSKKIRYTFAKAGAFEVGCHQPGHYNAGMRINVKVS